jgi:RNA polymerase sigma factor (sigma-70 family)
MPARLELASLTDESLFELVQKLDMAAFDEFYKRFERRLMAYCLAVLGDVELAEDAYQTIMMKLFAARDRFTGGNLEAWIFTIARNTCLRAKEDRKRITYIDGIDDLPAELTGGLDSSEHRVIHDAIRSLPAVYREIIELRYFGELSYDELASQLNVTLDTVKVRLFRARKRLAELLRPHFR